MSGGAFEYGCFKISQFADDLEMKIRMNGSEEKNDWGDRIGSHYSKETIENLKEIQASMEKA